MLKRKQIQFTPKQIQAVQREAKRRGVSESEVVRDLVDRQLLARPPGHDEKHWERIFSIVGIARSDLTDISENHDEYYVRGIEDHLRESRERP